jgi:hypothetical protein
MFRSAWKYDGQILANRHLLASLCEGSPHERTQFEELEMAIIRRLHKLQVMRYIHTGQMLPAVDGFFKLFHLTRGWLNFTSEAEMIDIWPGMLNTSDLVG